MGPGISLFPLLPADLVEPPVLSVIGIVQQDGLEIVHGMGIPGFRGVPLFKFFEQPPELPGLVLRQQAKDPLRRLFLPFPLGLHRFQIIGKGISRIDFHHIMEEDHQKGPGQVKGLVGIFLQ